MRINFELNGEMIQVDVEPDALLLWVLREDLKHTGTKFGCGIAACGACTVHLNGDPVRSCMTTMKMVSGKKVTTIEGLGKGELHPVQQAWIDEQVPQCGYCQSGQIMQAAALLEKNKQPSRAEIIEHMNGVLCRCGTYHRIQKAIVRAAKDMGS
ncbi:MAG TPA: (2Fe-2S)-binding protein [Saprospiraceae bacterium]|nr:(2Fe-2S)-binding protein [Saprospiraceae bacterium]HQU51647.1 (2Fe-2S)-binding protein [Saprospiraceae bacterium]